MHPEESPPQYYQNIIKNSNDTHYWLHFSQLHAMSFIYKVVAWNVIFFPITIKLFKFVFRAAKHPDNSLWQKVKDKKIRVVVLHLNESNTSNWMMWWQPHENILCCRMTSLYHHNLCLIIQTYRCSRDLPVDEQGHMPSLVKYCPPVESNFQININQDLSITQQKINKNK